MTTCQSCDLAATEAVEDVVPETTGETVSWTGPIGIEGERTGDGRLIKLNGLRWDSLPIPLRWAMQDFGAHDGAYVVGHITEIERDEDGHIIGKGDFDLGSEHGREAFRQVDEDLTPGISMDLDDIVIEDEDDDNFTIVEGRIRAATLVAIPAFEGARIATDKKDTIELNWVEDVGGLPSYVKRISKHLQAKGMTESHAIATAVNVIKKMCATGDTNFPGAQEVNAGSRAEACTALAEWEAKKAAAAEVTKTIVASARKVYPPARWFQKPNFTEPTGLTVTEDGQVYGHIALWGTCHIANPQGKHVCTQPPSSPSNYAYFHLGMTTTDAGEVATGKITMSTLHATPRMSATDTVYHYEHTGAVGADVVAGEDSFGIWVAGAAREGADLVALKAAPVSGDWRTIGGALEMVATLSANVPGFPVPRTQALVASGAVQSLVASGIVRAEEWTGNIMDLDDTAISALRERFRSMDRKETADALAAKVARLAALEKVRRVAKVVGTRYNGSRQPTTLRSIRMNPRYRSLSLAYKRSSFGYNPDQWRVPKGNGKLSGRFVDMPDKSVNNFETVFQDAVDGGGIDESVAPQMRESLDEAIESAGASTVALRKGDGDSATKMAVEADASLEDLESLVQDAIDQGAINGTEVKGITEALDLARTDVGTVRDSDLSLLGDTGVGGDDKDSDIGAGEGEDTGGDIGGDEDYVLQPGDVLADAQDLNDAPAGTSVEVSYDGEVAAVVTKQEDGSWLDSVGEPVLVDDIESGGDSDMRVVASEGGAPEVEVPEGTPEVPLGWSQQWPAGFLEPGDQVRAETDENGDLVDLEVYRDGKAIDTSDFEAAELDAFLEQSGGAGDIPDNLPEGWTKEEGASQGYYDSAEGPGGIGIFKNDDGEYVVNAEDGSVEIGRADTFDEAMKIAEEEIGGSSEVEGGNGAAGLEEAGYTEITGEPGVADGYGGASRVFEDPETGYVIYESADGDGWGAIDQETGTDLGIAGTPEQAKAMVDKNIAANSGLPEGANTDIADALDGLDPATVDVVSTTGWIQNPNAEDDTPQIKDDVWKVLGALPEGTEIVTGQEPLNANYVKDSSADGGWRLTEIGPGLGDDTFPYEVGDGLDDPTTIDGGGDNDIYVKGVGDDVLDSGPGSEGTIEGLTTIDPKDREGQKAALDGLPAGTVVDMDDSEFVHTLKKNEDGTWEILSSGLADMEDPELEPLTSDDIMGEDMGEEYPLIFSKGDPNAEPQWTDLYEDMEKDVPDKTRKMGELEKVRSILDALDEDLKVNSPGENDALGKVSKEYNRLAKALKNPDLTEEELQAELAKTATALEEAIPHQVTGENGIIGKHIKDGVAGLRGGTESQDSKERDNYWSGFKKGLPSGTEGEARKAFDDVLDNGGAIDEAMKAARESLDKDRNKRDAAERDNYWDGFKKGLSSEQEAKARREFDDVLDNGGPIDEALKSARTSLDTSSSGGEKITGADLGGLSIGSKIEIDTNDPMGGGVIEVEKTSTGWKVTKGTPGVFEPGDILSDDEIEAGGDIDLTLLEGGPETSSGSEQQQASSDVMTVTNSLNEIIADLSESGRDSADGGMVTGLPEEDIPAVNEAMDGFITALNILDLGIQDGAYNADDLAIAQAELENVEGLLMAVADKPGLSDEQANKIGIALDDVVAGLGHLEDTLQGSTEAPPFARRKYVRQWLGRRGIRLGTFSRT